MTPKTPHHFRMNKNFGNFALARDRRVRGQWKPHGDDQVSCRLPGRKGVFIRLPRKARHRLPDGFDIGLLYFLLARAYTFKQHILRFETSSVLLRELGLPQHSTTWPRLLEALDLLSQMSVRFKALYRPAEYATRLRKRRRVRTTDAWGVSYETDDDDGIVPVQKKTRTEEWLDRVLPPPLVVLGTAPIRIKVSKAWLALGEVRWIAKVPLPLPSSASVQNLILKVLAYPDKRSKRDWCYAVGISHRHRNERLRRVIAETAEWFRSHDRQLICSTDGDSIEITFGKSEGQDVPKQGQDVPRGRTEHADLKDKTCRF